MREDEEKGQNQLSMWLVRRLIFASLQAIQSAATGPESGHDEVEDNRHKEQHSPRDKKLYYQNEFDNLRLKLMSKDPLRSKGEGGGSLFIVTFIIMTSAQISEWQDFCPYTSMAQPNTLGPRATADH